ncbi:MAG: tetratricopeptide repeat protein [Candidatus Eisenbacteria bacterium]
MTPDREADPQGPPPPLPPAAEPIGESPDLSPAALSNESPRLPPATPSGESPSLPPSLPPDHSFDLPPNLPPDARFGPGAAHPAWTPTYRGFAELHRDTWAVVRRAPFVIVVLPALIWFPADLLVELGTSALASDGWFEQLRMSTRLSGFMEFLVGTFLYGLVLSATRRVGMTGKAETQECVSDAFAVYGRLLGTTFLTNLRIVLGTLLLLVPGLWLAVKYVLVCPAVVYEDESGGSAIGRSGDLTRGVWWQTFGWVLLAMLIYLPLASIPTMFLPETAPPWLGSLSSVPFNIVSSIGMVALGLYFVDRTRPADYRAPVAPVQFDGMGRRDRPPAGFKFPVTVAVVAWVGLFAALMTSIFTGTDLVDSGDDAYYQGDYESAIELYEEALENDPGDAYTQYSLAATLWQIDRTAEALVHAELASDLEPDVLHYLLLEAQILVELERYQEAHTIVDRLKASPDLIGSELESVVEDLEITLRQAGVRRI